MMSARGTEKQNFFSLIFNRERLSEDGMPWYEWEYNLEINNLKFKFQRREKNSKTGVRPTNWYFWNWSGGFTCGSPIGEFETNWNDWWLSFGHRSRDGDMPYEGN